MRKVLRTTNVDGQYNFWCEGCGCYHSVWTKPLPEYGMKNPVWGYNGNEYNPTFTPSIRVQWTEGPDNIPKNCHTFITNGNIQYLDDCTHNLAGQTIALIPF